MSLPREGDRARVSVIVPVYNVRPWIEEALDSVLCQTWRNLEIILVDDGSTDGSGEVCKRYGAVDARIRIIRQPNRGLSAARNAGLDAMTGDVVAFLDPDDAYHPEMIERMMRALMDTGVGIIACGVKMFTGALPAPGTLPDAVPPRLMSGREALEATIMGGGLRWFAWNKLYPAKAFDGVRYPNGRVYEDVAVFPTLVDRCERVGVLDEVLVYHRVRKGSITRSNHPDKFLDRMQSHRELEDYVAREIPGGHGAAILKKLRRDEEKLRLICWNRLAGDRDADAVALRRELKREILRHRRDLAPSDIAPKINLAMMVVCPVVCKPLYLCASWLMTKWCGR